MEGNPVFVNFTNHPSRLWDEKQKNAAYAYGTVVDLPFPAVDPQGDEKYIRALADECMAAIMSHHPCAVLCQGEFTLCYQVISGLKERGVTVLAACSMRNVEECGERKQVVFSFERFRCY